MNQLTQISGLLPIMPEIVLAIGAMLLLMARCAQGENSGDVVNGLCIGVLWC